MAVRSRVVGGRGEVEGARCRTARRVMEAAGQAPGAEREQTAVSGNQTQ